MRRLHPQRNGVAGFACPGEGCPGVAIPVAMDGRFYIHRSMWINVPRDFLIPRCGTCKQDWFTPELDTATNKVLEASYQEHAALIEGILAKNKPE